MRASLLGAATLASAAPLAARAAAGVPFAATGFEALSHRVRAGALLGVEDRVDLGAGLLTQRVVGVAVRAPTASGRSRSSMAPTGRT